MINDVINGVAASLYEAFGDEYPIHQNDVTQGLKEPCFFIALLSPSMQREPNRRITLTVPLDVHYFPADSGDNAGMAEMAVQMMLLLDTISLPDGGMVRGTDRRCETVDGVLHCMVTYIVTAGEKLEIPDMEILHLTEGTINHGS